MGCYDTDLSMLRIPQLDLPKTPVSGDQLVLKYVHDPVASAKDNKTLKITDINSKKILKQLLSILNNILTL